MIRWLGLRWLGPVVVVLAMALGLATTTGQARALRPMVIAVDPGHGGRDPGAIGWHGIEEKRLTLAIGKDLSALIAHQMGLHAVLTRTGDYYVGLRRRTYIARRAGARLFVSIHADAGRPNWHGATVYTQKFKDATGRASDALADQISLKLKRLEPVHRDRRADFVVLRSANIPAVLVEVGYITNADQARKLTTIRFQKRLAAAIFAGIKRYLHIPGH